MGIFLRLLLLLAFAWVAYVLCLDLHDQSQLENVDGSRVVLLFAGLILDGAVIALILTLIVVPAVGDRLGSFFYNPGETVEHDLHTDAIAKLAQGDAEGAIGIYQEMIKKEPHNTHAVSEIARICCRNLGDTPRGAAVLEQALSVEWPHEQSSFLANRLADIYLLQSDIPRAREILVQIAENMEGTRYAANALHRIHEIDQAVTTNTKPPIYFEGVQDPSTARPAARGAATTQRAGRKV
jgi:tetratricopeptide (TPR) repeat protein